MCIVFRKPQGAQRSWKRWCCRRRKFQEGREGHSTQWCPRIEQDLGLCWGRRLQIQGKRRMLPTSAVSRLPAQAGDLRGELINNKISGEKKPWSITLANFRGVSTPTLANFKLPVYVTECGVKQRCSVAHHYVVCPPPAYNRCQWFQEHR